MNDVLDDFGDPVASECDEDEKTNYFGFAASSVCRACSIIWVISHVYGDHGDREPSTESSGDESSNRRNHEDVPVILGNIDDGLKHQNREGDTGDPRNETDDVEHRQNEVDDCSAVIVAREVDNSRTDSEDDLKNTRDPDSSV